LNKLSHGRHLSVGPSQPEASQLIDMTGEKMRLLYDAFTEPEPHCAQAIRADKLKDKVIEVYQKGIVIIGAISLLKGKTAATFAMISLLGNPVDIVRVLSLITLNSPEIFGPAGAAFVKFLGGKLLTSVILIADLMLWFVLTIISSIKIFSKKDIS